MRFYLLSTASLLGLLLLLNPSVSIAQPRITDFGNIDPQHLAMETYDQDTSASAVVLFDIGKSYFRSRGHYGVRLFFERHVRIKILKKSGYDWANVAIPYYKPSNYRKEDISLLKGATYNLVSSRVHVSPLAKESIFEEQTTDFGINRRKFTFPEVKEGSIIEYTYTIESDFYMHFRDWEFQSQIPVMWSQYTARIPEEIHYKTVMLGYEPLVIHTKTKKNEYLLGYESTAATEHVWAMQDVPALRGEPHITTLNDYRAQIIFELDRVQTTTFMQTWEEINKELKESPTFGRAINNVNFLKNEVNTIVAQTTDPVQQMTGIFDHLKRHMTWNKEHQVVLKEANSLKTAYDKGTGSSADINLLLVGMLRKANLTANPVILSTRGHGLVQPSLPMITRFDYVVAHVQIGSAEYLLDATEPLAPVNMLPIRCLNGQGRLISEYMVRWVSLLPQEKDITMHFVQLALNKEGRLVGQVINSFKGYAALPLRHNITVDGEAKYVENWKKNLSGLEVGKVSVENLKDLTKALHFSYDITLENQNAAAKVIYLNPMLTEAIRENPFKLENRKFPLDLATPLDKTFVCQIAVPEGYVLEEKPSDTMIDLPEGKGRFTYSVSSVGSNIQVLSNIRLNSPIFYTAEYQGLQTFNNLVVAKHAEQIVLRKVNGL